MQLLELIAILCSGVTGAGAVCLTIAAYHGAWTIAASCQRVFDVLAPVAMLGATSGIALGLLDAGATWMAGGLTLLLVGPLNLPMFQAPMPRELYEPAHVPEMHACCVMRQAAGGAASVLSFALFVSA